MKHISILGAALFGMIALTTSCNDEWTDEQYENYISFRAPLGNNGVTEVNVPYTRNLYDEEGNLIGPKYASDQSNGVGLSEYELPVIVSGSQKNGKSYTVHFKADPDTLQTLNVARFQLRTDLYYKDMTPYATYPENLTIKKGDDIELLNINFQLKGIDLVEKWVLPIQISDDPEYGYISHPRKHYAKAMLRVFPFNDWSGNYSGTALKIFITGDDANASAVENIRFYVVDENTVFFYPGTIDEDRKDRKNYKIYAKFIGTSTGGTIEFSCPNPAVKFESHKTATYRVVSEPDAIKDYLLHRYIIIDNIDYSFVDYTSVKDYELPYSATGTLTQERKINTQIKDQQHAIQW